MIRILLVGDQRFIRKWVKSLLDSESNLIVAGIAEDCKVAIQQIEIVHPDIVIIGDLLPINDVDAALQVMHQRYSSTRILALSDFDEEHLTNTVQANVLCCLSKYDLSTDELTFAIRKVFEGDIVSNTKEFSSLIPIKNYNSFLINYESSLNSLDVSEVPSDNRRFSRYWAIIKNRNSAAYLILFLLAVIPFAFMSVLAYMFLIPALKDPESGIYTSQVGYPALQRKFGHPIQVNTVVATTKALEDNTAAPGESVALQQVKILSKVLGTVEKVYVEEGQWVTQGQPLIQVEQTSFKNSVITDSNNVKDAEAKLKSLQFEKQKQLIKLASTLEAVKAQMMLAKNKFKNLNLLVKEGAISKFQLYDAQSLYVKNKDSWINAQQDLLTTRNNYDQQISTAGINLKNHQINLRNSRINLANTSILSNINGLVSEVNIHAGEQADPQNFNALITLSKNVVFKSYIDQSRLNNVKAGDQAVVRLISYPGRLFQGHVMRLNPTVNTTLSQPATVGIDKQYTFAAWIEVDGLSMPPGLQGYAQFIKPKDSLLIIPESAVIYLSGGEGMVMLVNHGRAITRKVKLGRILGNQREVISGLNVGMRVVLFPRGLKPGDRLETLDSAA
jgi:HlyD family secretion protein